MTPDLDVLFPINKVRPPRDGTSNLIFRPHHDAFGTDSSRFWADIFNDECHLRDFIYYRFGTVLESSHRTEQMP